LGGVTIEWALMDKTNVTRIATPDITIDIINAAAGQCRLDVPRAVTSGLTPGRYQDALRVTGAVRGILWVGPIIVKAAPDFGASTP
jgi:hypothetical protein